MTNELKYFDLNYLNNGVKILAGIDEAGRGPLAGPVVAAAVIFDKETYIEGINDSKKLSGKKREELYEKIYSEAIAVKTSIIAHTVIDEINILQASLKAMKNCFRSLTPKPDMILVDGNKIFPTRTKFETLVKGDGKSFSIAAASIIAKVTRDRLMVKLSAQYPAYNWHKNKGYGTREHIEAIKIYGATPLHRKTFLRNILSVNEENQLNFDGSQRTRK